MDGEDGRVGYLILLIRIKGTSMGGTTLVSVRWRLRALHTLQTHAHRSNLID